MHHNESRNALFFSHCSAPCAKIFAQFVISGGNAVMDDKFLPLGSLNDRWCRLPALPPWRIDEPSRSVTANVARFARLPFWRFAEMRADLTMTATCQFHVAENFMVALPCALLFSRIGDLVDKVGQQAYIFFLPQQNAVSRLAIPACASGFLVILFH